MLPSHTSDPTMIMRTLQWERGGERGGEGGEEGESMLGDCTWGCSLIVIVWGKESEYLRQALARIHTHKHTHAHTGEALLAVVSRGVSLNHLVEGLVVLLQESLLDLHQVHLHTHNTHTHTHRNEVREGAHACMIEHYNMWHHSYCRQLLQTATADSYCRQLLQTATVCRPFSLTSAVYM